MLLNQEDLPEVRPVPGAPGYFLSEDGRLFTIRIKEKETARRPNGYWGFAAFILGRAKLPVGQRYDHYLLHRAVLSAWDRLPKKGEECAHLDGDRSNNHADNLEWLTKAENEAHKIIHGTNNRPGRKSWKLSKRQVSDIRRSKKTRKELAEKYGVQASYITAIVLGDKRRRG